MHETIAFPHQAGGRCAGESSIEVCGSLIKNQTQAVAHSLRGDGFDASEDGTGRGTPLVVAHGIGSHSGAADAITSNQSHANGGPAGMGISKELAHSLRAGRIGSVATEMAVRRLTPRECEKLQGFTTVTERVVFDLCLDHQKDAVLAGLKCRRLQNNALIAEGGENRESALSADVHSWNDQESLNAVVHAHVRLSHAPMLHAIRSQGRLLWSASGAEEPKMFLPPMQQESIARVIVAVLQGAATLIKTGVEESRQNTTHFILPKDGNWSAVIFGQGNADCASGADAVQDADTTFTTSSLGQPIQNSEQAQITWLCSALNAIASFTPKRTSSGNIARLVLDIESDWTLIPYRKKPAEDCPDGPRYKALGNSMAVPCMLWIGQRVAMVEAIK